jgi:hypothetical protein
VARIHQFKDSRSRYHNPFSFATAECRNVITQTSLVNKLSSEPRVTKSGYSWLSLVCNMVVRSWSEVPETRFGSDLKRVISNGRGEGQKGALVARMKGDNMPLIFANTRCVATSSNS